MKNLILVTLLMTSMGYATPMTGIWTAYPKTNELQMSMQSDVKRNYRSQFPISYSALQGLSANDFGSYGAVQFSLVGDGGNVQFKGRVEGGKASGTYAFEKNQAYLDALDERGIYIIDEEECFAATVHNISLAFIDDIQALGYNPREFGTYLAFSIHGVDRTFIESFREIGYGHLDEDDLMAFAVHGVTPERILRMTEEFDRNLDQDDILSAIIHNVTPEFIGQFKALDLDLNIEDALAAKIHGVTPDRVAHFRELGVTDNDIDTYVAFSIHGVDDAFIQELADRGFDRVSDDDLVAMRIHGVSPEFIDALDELGVTRVSADDLVAFRIHGVTPEYVADRKAKGQSISADALVESRIFRHRHRHDY